MRYGFIRKPEDIKALILYCLSKLPFILECSDLFELVSVDGGFDYFEMSDCAASLVSGGYIHIAKTARGTDAYLLSEKGSKLCDISYENIPKSVRDRADKRVASVISRIQRERSIRVTREKDEFDDSYMVTLSILSSRKELLSIRLRLYSEDTCREAERNFKKNAEDIYDSIIKNLSDNVRDKGDKK